jgi:hypothetical protein
MIIKSQLLRGLFGIEKETLADLCFTLDNLSIVKTLFKSGSNIFGNIATKLRGEVVDKKKELKEYEDFISNSLNWHRNAAINNFCEILDIKDFKEIDSVREIDDICQSIENKAIVAQKELNKKFKGKNIIDFQIYNIQLVEKSFSKIDKDDRKEIGESMDEHFTILSKKGKTFKEPINKVKSNFGVKDFKYKSIKKILKNENYLKKLLVTDDEQGKLIRFILSEIVISIGKSLVDKTKFYGTLMASSTALLFVFTGGLEALLAGGFTGVLDRVRGKKAKMTILCYSVFLLSLNSLETLDPFDEIKEYIKEHNEASASGDEEINF